MWLLYHFLLWKRVMYVLKVTDENSRTRIRIRIHQSEQKYVSADPDPYQNFVDPQHCKCNYTLSRLWSTCARTLTWWWVRRWRGWAKTWTSPASGSLVHPALIYSGSGSGSAYGSRAESNLYIRQRKKYKLLSTHTQYLPIWLGFSKAFKIFIAFLRNKKLGR
jgi:hypothetical protein